jgi:hypothetical protein
MKNENRPTIYGERYMRIQLKDYLSIPWNDDSYDLTDNDDVWNTNEVFIMLEQKETQFVQFDKKIHKTVLIGITSLKHDLNYGAAQYTLLHQFTNHTLSIGFPHCVWCENFRLKFIVIHDSTTQNTFLTCTIYNIK